MSKNFELEHLKSILKTEEQKKLLEWLSQELSFQEILDNIKSEKKKKEIIK